MSMADKVGIIEASTKWPMFCRQHFYVRNSTEVCCWRYNWQKVRIGSGNGLVLNRHQAITWTNYDWIQMHILTYYRLDTTNSNEIAIKIQQFSFMKINLKMLSAKCHPFCLGLNVLSEAGVLMGWVIRAMTWYHGRWFHQALAHHKAHWLWWDKPMT